MILNSNKRQIELNRRKFKSIVMRVKHGVKSFHQDEGGLKVVEMLLIIFVVAIILIGFLKVFFPDVLSKVKEKMMELLGMSVNG